jgi:hypothetical protein
MAAPREPLLHPYRQQTVRKSVWGGVMVLGLVGPATADRSMACCAAHPAGSAQQPTCSHSLTRRGPAQQVRHRGAGLPTSPAAIRCHRPGSLARLCSGHTLSHLPSLTVVAVACDDGWRRPPADTISWTNVSRDASCHLVAESISMLPLSSWQASPGRSRSRDSTAARSSEPRGWSQPCSSLSKRRRCSGVGPGLGLRPGGGPLLLLLLRLLLLCRALLLLALALLWPLLALALALRLLLLRALSTPCCVCPCCASLTWTCTCCWASSPCCASWTLTCPCPCCRSSLCFLCFCWRCCCAGAVQCAHAGAAVGCCSESGWAQQAAAAGLVLVVAPAAVQRQLQG